MAFTVHDFADLTRLLAAHPEWQAELRRHLLADDFLALPAIVRELAAAQKRAEERLAAAAEHLARLDAAVARLAEEQVRMRDDLASLKGYRLERAYVERAPAYFGEWLKRVRVVWPGTLDGAVEDALEQRLDRDELREVLRLDLLVRGRLREPVPPQEGETWLAVEVSAVIDRGDVERVRRRAALLRKAGYAAVPVAAGEDVTEGAAKLSEDAGVALVVDGRNRGWAKALAELKKTLG